MNYDTINDAATMRPDAEGRSALGSIDKYELVRELGEGGFGVVYLAHDTVAKTDAAVKGLPPEVKHNPAELESIRGNFALVKRLRHPNIVAVTDLHLAQSVRYLSKDAEEKLRVFPRDTMVVMDYAPGLTLAQWRKKFQGCRVPVAKALEVVRQVASALDYAHGQKVLHRDVKPANVMVEESSDGRLAAHVLDFGLAAEIRSSMGRVSREIRDTSGTRPYMAPEQWLGKKQGPATDQYSLAVLFYELVVGEVPFASVFDCGDTAVMRLAVTTDTPEIPSSLPKNVRRALAVALAKNPEERFASCGEFAAALEGKKVSRRGAETQRKRGAGRVIAALALLAALAGGVWWMKEGTTGTDGTDSLPVSSGPAVASVPEPKPADAEEWAKAEAVKIRIEAKVEQGRVTRISNADGFDRRKNALADVFARAEAHFDDKVRRWSEAAQGFSNYVAQCGALRKLDEERLSAVSARERAAEAKRKAENAEAKKYAETRWREANDLMEKGVDEFGQMHFVESVTAFASAAEQFGKCESEAKDERARRDDEARKERERKEREAAEKAQALERKRNAALQKILNDPLQYENVIEDLTERQRLKLTPIYENIVSTGKRRRQLLIDYTENHPEVIAAKKKLDVLASEFKEQVELFAGSVGAIKRHQSLPIAEAQETYEERIDPKPQMALVGRLARQRIDEERMVEVATNDSTKVEEVGVLAEGWVTARKSLKFDGVVKSQDGTGMSVVINDKVYDEGDLISVSTNGIRWTWRVSGLKAGKIKFERVRARKLAINVPSKIDTIPVIGDHNKVQLWEGGPYWADRNVGAENPWDYGYYFWWGDTVGYKRVNGAWVASDGSLSNFSFEENNTPTCGKNIDVLRNAGWITADNVLTLKHDAAWARWGGGWRVPTRQEMDDLCQKCDWVWTTMNGVNGYVVRGRDGYASNSIFLPCAGNGYGTSLIAAGSYGRYGSSILSSDNSRAWSLGFNSDNHWTYCSRGYYIGLSIRPVQGFAK